MSPTDLPEPKRRASSSRAWRRNAVRLLIFILVLAVEAGFNVGILLGRLRWKNDESWIQPIFFIMSVTLAVLLWALYRQVWRITREYIDDADGSNHGGTD